LHVALHVEKATGEKISKCSVALRRCLHKLRHGMRTAIAYHSKATPNQGASKLRQLIASMTRRTTDRLYTQILSTTYAEVPYASMDGFVLDVAAICKTFPRMMRRKVEKKTTVLSSLEHATTPNQLGYLRNTTKIICSHPGIDVMYGTTQNEAFHAQLKSHFRNVMIQTRRHAKAVCQIVTLAKLIAGVLAKTPLIKQLEEHELLRAVSNFLWEGPLQFKPLLSLKTDLNERIDADALPSSAKRLKKNSGQ
jgi:hypothetical protein